MATIKISDLDASQNYISDLNTQELLDIQGGEGFPFEQFLDVAGAALKLLAFFI